MQADSLSYLGRAIESAFEAAVYPALLALVVALRVVAVLELRARAQLRPAVARQAARRPPGARSVRSNGALNGRA